MKCKAKTADVAHERNKASLAGRKRRSRSDSSFEK
jgi:hypothetical protein